MIKYPFQTPRRNLVPKERNLKSPGQNLQYNNQAIRIH